MTTEQENIQASEALEAATAEFFESLAGTSEQTEKEEPQPEVEQESVSEDESGLSETENNVDEIEKENSNDDNAENNESEPSLERELSGFNQEYKDAVSLIEDPDLRTKLIEAGKKQRASIDRKHQELGESKKLVERVTSKFEESGLAYSKHDYPRILENFIEFDKRFTQDPASAIELLAKSANIDLNTLNKSTVQQPQSADFAEVDDQDDYKTPEEIALEKRVKVLEQQDKIRQQAIKQQEVQSSQQMISDFMNSKDKDGNLKYPHFEQVREDMALLITKPNMDLEKAYNKAILLNDDLLSKRESQILKKAEEKRRLEVERAKKLKKQNVNSTKLDVTTTDPRVLLSNAVDKFYSM